MPTRVLAAALLTAWAALPAQAQTGYEYSPQWLVYSVNQVCQAWTNGIGRCFPVAMIGPAPAYMPPGLQPLMPAPPVVNPYLPAMANPYFPPVTNPYMPPPIASVPAWTAAGTATPAPSTAAAPPATAARTTPAAKSPVVATSAPAPARLEDALAHFGFDSAELSEAGRRSLDDWLTHVPMNTRVRVTGHADRLGPAAYNRSLSLRRAQAVMRHLAGKGMRPNDILISARGEAVPVVHCTGGPTPTTIACLAPNRRVEIEPR